MKSASTLVMRADHEAERVVSHGVHEGFRARLNRLSMAVLGALSVAFVLAVYEGAGLGETTPRVGPRLGGDFPAFYGAGRVVNTLGFDSLYVPAAQQAAQAGLGVDGYLAFAYAPHVALPYSLLALLDFRIAYTVHTLVMVAALALSLRLIEGPLPTLRNYRLPAFAATLTFYPLMTAAFGGQNTAISVLLLAWAWSSWHRGDDALAGLAIGLLAFRPQYALPLLGLSLLARHWRTVLVATVTIASTWLLNALLLGAGWFSAWIDEVLPFVERDADVNAHNSISLQGFLHAVAGDGSFVRVVGLVGAAVTALLMSYVWFDRRFQLDQRVAVAAAGILLMSPHTMFYDAGLLIIGFLAVAAAWPHRAVWMLGAGLWLGALAHLGAKTWGSTPLAVFPLLVLVAGAAARSTISSKTSHT